LVFTVREFLISGLRRHWSLAFGFFAGRGPARFHRVRPAAKDGEHQGVMVSGSGQERTGVGIEWDGGAQAGEESRTTRLGSRLEAPTVLPLEYNERS
jgi:hypothetical protein